MRAVLAILLAAVALWRAVSDWHDTIGAGYAFRMRSIGLVISEHWPASYDHLVESLQSSGVPFAWDPVGAFVLALPLSLIPALLAAAIWVTRPRGGDGRRARAR
jgi:hypothetical protein